MHICTVTVAIVHKCTILHPLIWAFFFLPKCVKSVTFSILQNFPQVDVVAFRVVFLLDYPLVLSLLKHRGVGAFLNKKNEDSK